MPSAEFDRFAAHYEEMHARSIRISGETADYFAAYKVQMVSGDVPDTQAPPRILDFGGGTGNSLGHFRRLFPRSNIVLADPSARSLALAGERFPGAAELVHLTGDRLPFEDGHFDVAFAACVFHHIPAAGHHGALQELRRVLSARGRLFVFEHNPLNPLTLKAVRDCPFDEDAVLIRAGEMAERLRGAGFGDVRTQYCVFFPHMLRHLRVLEPWLGRIPLGAQYCLRADR